jgi:mannosyltransferase OCH1-like enzyme
MPNRIIILALLLIVLVLALTRAVVSKENFGGPKDIHLCHKDFINLEKATRSWRALNPDYKINLYDNALCREMIESNFPPQYAKLFDFLKDGPIKADFWRLCVLYLYGGVYADADIQPITPIDKFVEEDADLVICSTYEKDYAFNPNFIIAGKRNPVIKQVIDWYLRKYEKKDKYEYWDWSVVQAFTQTLRIPNYDKSDKLITLPSGAKIQVLKQVRGNKENNLDDYVEYNGVMLFKDRHPDYDPNTHQYK